jgi:hypothetical protein
MPVDLAQPTEGPWRDADGTPIRLRSWVEQIAVDEDRGALPDRLHKRDEVVGRGTEAVYVVFDRDYLVALPPHLMRVLTAPGGCRCSRHRLASPE